MTKAEQQELEQIMDIIANLFNRICFMCDGSYDEIKNKIDKKTHKKVPGKRKSFTVHHREYKPSDLKYSHFKIDGKYTLKSRLEYYRYLLPILIIEVMQAKDMEELRFRFMHQAHHHRLEEFARYKPRTLRKAINIVLEMNQAKYNYIKA